MPERLKTEPECSSAQPECRSAGLKCWCAGLEVRSDGLGCKAGGLECRAREASRTLVLPSRVCRSAGLEYQSAGPERWTVRVPDR